MSAEPIFKSWKSYWDFAHEVTRRRRYVWSPDSRAFLEAVVRTSEKRQVRLPVGHRLFRAQVAHGEFDDPDAGTLARPADPERMLPLVDAATDGRANPRGIPCPYVADSRHTAIAEVRPWIGSLVSVAILRTLKDPRGPTAARHNDKTERLERHDWLPRLRRDAGS